MNLQDALIAMASGAKVKLPEWTGYWFIDLLKTQQGTHPSMAVHVFTKTGDILDTPWVDKYKDRDDFEVTEGRLGFDFAVLALKNKKLVTREGWGGKDIYVKMQVPDAHSKMTRPYFYMTVMPHNSIQFGDDHNHEVNRMPYTPNQTDLFADDWKIYDGENAE